MLIKRDSERLEDVMKLILDWATQILITVIDVVKEMPEQPGRSYTNIEKRLLQNPSCASFAGDR